MALASGYTVGYVPMYPFLELATDFGHQKCHIIKFATTFDPMLPISTSIAMTRTQQLLITPASSMSRSESTKLGKSRVGDSGSGPSSRLRVTRTERLGGQRCASPLLHVLVEHLVDGRCRILMLSPSPWAGTMHHQCRPFPVWRSGCGGFLILFVTRDNIGDQRYMPIRQYLSLVHL